MKPPPPAITIPATPCPVCGEQLGQAMDPARTGATRTPGHPAICVHCAAPLIWEPGLTLRPLRVEDLLTLPPAVVGQLADLQAIIREYRASHN